MKTRKFLISGLLIILLVLNFGSGIVAEMKYQEITAYLDNTMSIQVDGKDLAFAEKDGAKYKPIVYDDQIYLPLKALADVFGAEASWNDETNIVNIQQPGNSNSSTNIENRKVKNVIFMIGDGMGLNQVQLTQWYYVGAYDKLNMQKMPVIGLVST